jgi:predicted MPP superfamily phosphohydrolase
LIPGSIALLKKYLLEEKADAASFGEIHFFKNNADGTRRPIYKTVFKHGVFTLADALCSNYFIGQSGNYLFTKNSWIKAGRYFEPSLINQTLDSWTFTIRQLGTGAKLVKLADTHYLHRNMPESHWNREIKKGNVSLAALTGIMPFLEMIKKEDIDICSGKAGTLGLMIWKNGLSAYKQGR